MQPTRLLVGPLLQLNLMWLLLLLELVQLHLFLQLLLMWWWWMTWRRWSMLQKFFLLQLLMEM